MHSAAAPRPPKPTCCSCTSTCKHITWHYSACVARPQVKLLKCLVDGIVVDVSFNQLGGLFTLNFLEEVDLAIGGEHIFKRAIILVRQ